MGAQMSLDYRNTACMNELAFRMDNLFAPDDPVQRSGSHSNFIRVYVCMCVRALFVCAFNEVVCDSLHV